MPARRTNTLRSKLVGTIRKSARRNDIIALAALIAIPAIAIGIPALLGHPLLIGDDLRQGFPLRVLAGYDIAHGHLPLWNPYIWSGTPLLGSFVAGSFYPTILLFAILPPLTAWTFSMIIAYGICASGTYLLARKIGLATIPSFLASATFTFFGVMSFQVIHIEIVDGYSWIPWFLLGIEGLASALHGSTLDDRTPNNPTSSSPPLDTPAPDSNIPNNNSTQRRRLAGWTALAAFAAGMAALSGSPDSLKELAIACVIAVIWHVSRRADLPGWKARRRFVLLVAVACLWGAAAGAVQIIPGMLFQHISQVTDGSWLYSFGFLPLPFWAWLIMLVPGISGGNGTFSLWVSGLSVYEWSGYIGLLPLASLGALLTRSFGRRKDPSSGKWLMWGTIAAVGTLLAMAPNIPGLSLLSHLPLYGSTRIQERSLLLVDLGLAMMLGFFADRVSAAAKIKQCNHSDTIGTGTSANTGATPALSAPGNPDTHDTPARPPLDRWEIIGAAIPMACTVALVVFAAVDSGALENIMGVPTGFGNLIFAAGPFFAFPAIMAIEIAFFIKALTRISRQAANIFFIAMLIVDAGFFWITISPMVDYTTAHQLSLSQDTTAKITGYRLSGNKSAGVASARTALMTTTYMPPMLANAAADRNIITGIPSVQGYGALVWKRYDAATCTHQSYSLRIGALASSTFDRLDLGTLVVLPEGFISGIESPAMPFVLFSNSEPSSSHRSSGATSRSYSHGSKQTAESSGSHRSTSKTLDWGVCPPQAYSTSAGGRKSALKEWFIGQPEKVRKVVITTSSQYRTASQLSVALLDTHGQDHRLSIVRSAQAMPYRAAPPSQNTGTGKEPNAYSSPNSTSPLQLVATFSKPVAAVAIKISGSGSNGVSANQVSLALSSGAHASLNGPLATIVQPDNWSYQGTVDSFAIFRNLRAKGHLWLAPITAQKTFDLPSGTSRGGKTSQKANTALRGDTESPASAVTVKAYSNGREVDRAATPVPAMLIRSEAWAPGWTATIRAADAEKNGGGQNGSTRVIRETVKRYGIIQAVAVPAGESTVTFTYWPPGFTKGIILSVTAFLGFMATIAVILGWTGRLRRHRSSKYIDQA